MKINEVFEGLIKDKDSSYELMHGNHRNVMSISELGYFTLKVFDERGREIDFNKGTGGFTGNLQPSWEWDLVRQPVDFLTAINSKNKIIPIIEGADKYQVSSYWLDGRIGTCQINGKWFIENSQPLTF